MTAAPSTPAAGVAPGRGTSLSAVGTLLSLSLRQFARGRRMLVLAALFALPAIVAAILRFNLPEQNPDDAVFAIILGLVPHALLPLVALLYATGMIQDEIEEQTLTYLLVRPIPRWTIYIVKLFAAWLVSVAIMSVFVTLAYLVIYWGREAWIEKLAARVPTTLLLFAISLLAYCSVFGVLSLVAKRSLATGVAYVVALEWVLANIDFVLRKVTVMYYFRVLALRWLPIQTPDQKDWSIPLSDAPSAAECLAILLGASAVLTLIAARTFSMKEFRMKTPEGS